MRFPMSRPMLRSQISEAPMPPDKCGGGSLSLGSTCEETRTCGTPVGLAFGAEAYFMIDPIIRGRKAQELPLSFVGQKLSRRSRTARKRLRARSSAATRLVVRNSPSLSEGSSSTTR